MLRKTLSKIKSRYINIRLKAANQIEINSNWYGTDYGGFYVFPDILNKTSIIYSFGVGEDTSFDEKLIITHGCKVHAFDPTPKSIQYVENKVKNAKFIFTPVGIDSKDGEVVFNLPKNQDHVSGSKITMGHIDAKNRIMVPMKTLQTLMKERGHERIDLLKMDIEGSEYDVIENILESKIEIKQLVIEFHHRMLPKGINLTNSAIKKLNHAGYKIFAISKTGEEISFLKCERN